MTAPTLFKAIAVSTLFAGAGLLGYVWYPGQGVPVLGLFYAILVVNTYFSIQFYDHLFPRLRLIDWAIEIALVFLYLGLAATLHSVILFEVIGLLLFVVAAAKYTVLLGQGMHEKTLHKKIRIDLLGVLLFVFGLTLAAAGFELESAWAVTALFFAANLYLLFIKPMYRVVP